MSRSYRICRSVVNAKKEGITTVSCTSVTLNFMLLSLAEKCVTHLLWPASEDRKEVEYIQGQWKVSIGEKQD